MEEIVWQGRFITTKRDGKWEYVSRARDIEAAVIVALNDGHILLVEQYRVPLGAWCLELPAGLVGDDHAGEAMRVAAARELEEETGYRAEHLTLLGRFASSPGMVSETFMLVKAEGLTKVGAGGGVEDEDITVHRVKLSDIPAFVAAKRDEGVVIDVKILLLLARDILG
jgi:ADP-ribose pyrophosphatase